MNELAIELKAKYYQAENDVYEALDACCAVARGLDYDMDVKMAREKFKQTLDKFVAVATGQKLATKVLAELGIPEIMQELAKR